MRVAILGASNKSDRFSYRAFKMLQEYGHVPIPVTPKFDELEGVRTYSSLTDIPDEVDTLTMYVGPETSSRLKAEILQLKPRRVIFNPGSENPQLEEVLIKAGIKVEEACTLVLLRAKQF